MVAYRWGKVNTHFSAKVCTLRICTHLQPICDTFFCMQKHSKRLPLECYLIVNRQTFNKILVLLFAKTWMVKQKLAQSTAKICSFLQKNCTIFPSKRAKYFINHLRTCAECIVCLTTNPCNFLCKNCVVFRKFAHFLPTRGCFFDVLHCLAVSKMYLAH